MRPYSSRVASRAWAWANPKTQKSRHCEAQQHPAGYRAGLKVLNPTSTTQEPAAAALVDFLDFRRWVGVWGSKGFRSRGWDLGTGLRGFVGHLRSVRPST